jgi:hypothetical protein
MSQDFASLSAAIKAKGEITDTDTLAVRRVVWPDGVLQPHEVDEIFALNTACEKRSRDWVDFFVEALNHYLVRQTAPVGYIDAANADWLMAHIDSDGKVDSLAELELLAKLLETATAAPASLTVYALKQIERAVMMGTGATRTGGTYNPGVIDAAEVVLLRRLLFAQAGEGATIISRDEAELLFRLKDATLGAENAAGWHPFFIQAVGNHLMAHSDYKPLSIDDAKRLDAFTREPRVCIGGFMSKMLSLNGTAEIGKLFGRKASRSSVEHEDAVAASEALTTNEVAWLKAQMLKDSNLDEVEKALLSFVVEENGELPEELQLLQKNS